MGLLFLLSVFGVGAALLAVQPDDSGADDTGDNAPDGSDTLGGDDTTGPRGSLSGTASADTLSANGTRTLHGFAGNDTLSGSGKARVFGDLGRDVLTLAGNSAGYGGFGDDDLTGTGTPSLYGGSGDDRLSGGNSRLLDGGDGDDLLSWAPLANDPTGHTARLSGGAGDDTIRTWGQDDGSIVAAGGGGDDLIAVGNTGIARGASGADTLVGASGTELFGGAGADLFVAMHRTPGLYAGSDDPVVIGDFVKGTDRIAVELDSPPRSVTFGEQGDDTLLTITWGDDGQTAPDARVLVKGVTGLGLADFDFVTGSGFNTQSGLDFTLGRDIDPATGTAGDDRLAVPDGAALVLAGAGDDTVTGGPTNAGSIVSMGDGDDSYAATGSSSRVDGGAGNDTFEYTPFAGPDGAARFVTFAGGTDDDLVTIGAPVGGPGINTNIDIDLGSGNDTLSVDRDATAAITAFDGDGDDDLSIWMGQSATVYGAGDDTLTVNIAADHLASRSAARAIELTADDSLVLNVDAALPGDITFDSGFDGANGTAILIGGKTVLVVDGQIGPDDPRLTVNRNVALA